MRTYNFTLNIVKIVAIGNQPYSEQLLLGYSFRPMRPLELHYDTDFDPIKSTTMLF